MKAFISENKNEIILFFIAAFFSISVLLLSNIRFSNDDQFILYRYIENIANGDGFVYNSGEKILGSTTALFTLLSSAVLFISSHIGLPFDAPDIVAFINIATLSLSVVVFYKILRLYVAENYSLIGAVIFALNLTKIVPEGMETGVFIFLSLTYIHSLIKERNKTSAIILGLMIITRPDAVLVAILSCIFWILNYGWKKTTRLISLSAITVLPWIVFATLYFGSFVPQSLMAKTHTADIVNQSSYQAAKVQLAHISRLYWGKVFDPQDIKLQVVVNLIPVLSLFVYGLANIFNKKNWIIFAVPLVYLTALSLSNPVMFPWYLSQVEPFWILGSFIGAVYIINRLNYKLLTLIPIFILAIGPIFIWANSIIGNDETSKKALYDIGHYLKDKVEKDEVVAVNNIGIIGYYSRARIYDLFGLVNPEAPAFYPVSDECRDKTAQYVIPPSLIRHRAPDWLVTSGDREMVECFKNGEWFASNYQMMEEFGGGKIYKKMK